MFNNIMNNEMPKEIKDAVIKLGNIYNFPINDAIKLISNTISMPYNKSKNEINAKNMEKKIVTDINNNTEYGKEIKKQFFNIFKKNIVSAKRVGEKKHYDIEFILDDSTTFRCELKSSKKHNPKKWKMPWQYATQYLNGTGDKFRIIKWYGEEWYRQLPEIKKKYNLQNDIPSLEDWWKMDANMGSVRTAFGKEFKESVSAKERGILKKCFVNSLVVPEEEVHNLLTDYIRESKLVLEEKDCWLVVSESHNDIVLFDQIQPPSPTTTIYRKKCADLVYSVDSKNFKEIRIRWQNGNGLANISVQCK